MNRGTSDQLSAAAALLGRRGGAAATPAQQAAARRNGRLGGRPAWRSGPYAPTLHRDGTVTWWDVYRQVWLRSDRIPDESLASFTPEERAAVERHIAATNERGGR